QVVPLVGVDRRGVLKEDIGHPLLVESLTHVSERFGQVRSQPCWQFVNLCRQLKGGSGSQALDGTRSGNVVWPVAAANPVPQRSDGLRGNFQAVFREMCRGEWSHLQPNAQGIQVDDSQQVTDEQGGGWARDRQRPTTGTGFLGDLSQYQEVGCEVAQAD